MFALSFELLVVVSVLVLSGLGEAKTSLVITFHGGSDCTYCNIGIYGQSGKVKGYLLTQQTKLELRGMAEYNNNIYFAGGAKSTFVYVASGTACSQATLTPLLSSPLLDHPYDIAISARGKAFVANQNSNNIVTFTMSGMQVTKFASLSQQSPRGITFNNALDCLAVGAYDETDQGDIYIFNSTGQLFKSFAVEGEPVGVYYSEENGWLYVTIHSHESKILAYDPRNNYRQVLSVSLSSVDDHPTGLVDVNGLLYVLGQKSRALYTFNSTTGKDREKIADFTDDPEQILFAC